MNRKLIIMTMSMLFMASMALMTGCKKEDEAPVVALTTTDFSGEVGETATTTATVTAEGGLKTFRITKFIGTTVDNSYGTNGTLTVTGNSHTLSYVLSPEGVQNPVRFKFEAEDNNGKTGSKDFVIIVEPTIDAVLLAFDWRLDSKVGKELAAEASESEKVKPCEKDNVYSFNADGTYTIDLGALTGTGGGTCDFDGLNVPTTWTLNNDNTELTLKTANVFTGAETVEVFDITSFGLTEIKAKTFVDLSVFGPDFAAWDWTFTWKAQAK
jgi:hypothetical protein